MVETNDLTRREELIKQDTEKLAKLRDERDTLSKKIANLKYDITNNFPDDRVRQERLKELLPIIEDLKEKIRFYTIDLHNAELTIKKDKKESVGRVSSKSNREDWEEKKIHNDKTREEATNHLEPYTDDEIRDIFLGCDNSDIFPNEEIDNMRKKLKRTYRDIEQIVAQKEHYIEYGEIRKIREEDDDKFLNQLQRILDELKEEGKISIRPGSKYRRSKRNVYDFLD